MIENKTSAAAKELTDEAVLEEAARRLQKQYPARKLARCGHMNGPFGHGHIQRPERFCSDDRPLPVIHSFLDRLYIVT